ncbi:MULTISPECIES: NAD-dependent epimerase/dehydratase family protein [Cyanophyceae]|uniref:NAD-dependent epimerase/dehydratase family protein n=1 Tax=Cyanophyceae TaxID=3028117 RepID=UPI00168201EF|nr:MULTISPECIES: NAD-dependent epimerase/dehydratase family protein [unclassified Phormidium]MBD1916315.1 NAD-dependent epimerase/dehydratase family protein [Phormidium sp. FACHB-77]MBD2032607.1 NAD-dependent epimerase/dehydratase family protein [Phormidium sp. FACHB-322]MBD2049979.1 NAD-dependent epimerase/dehydratase family protein [Leptolyngbya sp. FACHB-60]
MITPSKVVLVTGAAGFIGRYVVRYFMEQGWAVVGIDNSLPENAPLSNLTVYHRLQLPDSNLKTIFQETSPQVLIHCAGRASVGLSVKDPEADFYGNTVLTFELLNALRLHAPQCRFILLSSAAVYGNPDSIPISEDQLTAPISPYGFHKLQCEQICLEFTKLYQVPTAAVRIFSAYGPGLRRQVLWDICQKAIVHHSVQLQGTGQESRDFIHALDIAKALFTIAKAPTMEGETYNLATGREVTIAEIAGLVLETLEYEGRLEFDGKVPTGNPLHWKANISKLQTLGFIPSVALERGVQTFTNWCRAELVGV